MKILVVQETDWVDRNPILHHRMLETLAMEGDDVVVIDFDIQWHTKHRRPRVQPRTVVEDCHKFFPHAPITIVRPPMLRVPGLARPSWLLANWPELRRQFRSFEPDVVVAYSISNAYLALRLARRHGVPLVYHVLDALHTLAEPKVLRPIARPIERSILRGADDVIVVNNGLRDYALEMGAPAENLHVIPMGVEHRPTEAIHPEHVRASLGFDRDDVVLLFMGWLYRFSGLPELVTELARHRDEVPWLKLLVVGDGDLSDELTAQVRDLGLGDRVVLTGRRPVSEMPQYVAAADFGLLAAQPVETMEWIVPAKVVEYMEGGTPVVATRLRGIKAEFGDLPGIIYVDGPHSVIDALRALLQDRPDRRALARELGSSCTEFMARRPSWDDVTNRFRDIVHRPRAALPEGHAGAEDRRGRAASLRPGTQRRNRA
jgi:glycosyltransferase involved in cell wall biosynthesis